MLGKDIKLEDRELLEPKLRRLHSYMIDYTFTNLYLFREIHNHQLVERRDLYIRGKTRDGLSFITPLTPIPQIDWKDLAECMEPSDLLFPMEEEWLSYLPQEQYEWSFAEMDDDYLYHLHKMAHLPGRKLSSRRNLVHQFLEHYPAHELLELTEEHLEAALQVLQIWQQHPHSAPHFTDYDACKEALKNRAALKLQGWILYVEQQPGAFLLGEGVEKSYIYHMAKADIRYKGIYQFLFEVCAQKIENQYEWINLGQDIGSPDIRHSKRSYQPDKLLHKMRVKKK